MPMSRQFSTPSDLSICLEGDLEAPSDWGLGLGGMTSVRATLG
jgi:hypothetical protein